MKISRKMMGISLGILAVVGLAGWRGADHGFCHRGMNPEQLEQMSNRFLDHALDDIKATPDQRKKLQGMKDELFKEGMSLRDERKDSMEEALKVWDSANPNPQAVHAMVDARIDRMRAFAHEAADKVIEAHGVLTPEQRAQVSARIREHHNAEE